MLQVLLVHSKLMFRSFLAGICWKEQAKLEEVSKESQRREEQIIADLEVCRGL